MPRDITAEVKEFYEEHVKERPLIEMELENVTPALVGGWRGHPIIDFDRCIAEGPRPTDIAGKIRWWLRAIFAGAYYEHEIRDTTEDIEEIFKRMPRLDELNLAVGKALMGYVKGRKACASKISIVVEDESCREHACSVMGEVRKIAKESPRVRLATLGGGENEYKIPLPPGFYKFKLKIYKRSGTNIPKQLRDVLKIALGMWTIGNGIGGIVNRGYGRLKCTRGCNKKISFIEVIWNRSDTHDELLSKYAKGTCRGEDNDKTEHCTKRLLFVFHEDFILYPCYAFTVQFKEVRGAYSLTSALSKVVLNDTISKRIVNSKVLKNVLENDFNLFVSIARDTRALKSLLKSIIRWGSKTSHVPTIHISLMHVFGAPRPGIRQRIPSLYQTLLSTDEIVDGNQRLNRITLLPYLWISPMLRVTEQEVPRLSKVKLIKCKIVRTRNFVYSYPLFVTKESNIIGIRSKLMIHLEIYTLFVLKDQLAQLLEHVTIVKDNSIKEVALPLVEPIGDKNNASGRK